MGAAQSNPQARAKITKVAVLTDFSENAAVALRFAARIARGFNANIVLAHADIPPSCIFDAPAIKFIYQALDHWRERLRASLLAQTKAIYLHDVECTVLLHEGTPKELLEDLSDADLIVVGTSGKTGWQKMNLGSTAEEIFRSSRVPVLTVGPHCGCSGAEEMTIKTVLYATNLSAGADTALSYALSLAGEHDAILILLHVVNDKDVPFSFESTMASAEPMEKLRLLVPDTSTLKYKPAYVIGFGRPDVAILEVATKRNVNAIVMGARGAGYFAGALTHFPGGTAYRVAANAACPVLTVRGDS